MIPFDEFFRVNDARANIRMIPPHATLNTTVKGKTLYINWEEELRPNTTYAIYMNRAIKDVAEGNDSVMQYVFSTGSFIDSLSYTIPLIDARTNQPERDVIVAFSDPETGELLNFTQSNDQGIAQLTYLAQRSYNVLAFVDENGDMEAQDHERIGFLPSDAPVQVDSSGTSELPIRMFNPLAAPELRTTTYIPPGSFVLGANRPITNERIYFQGQLVEKERYIRHSADSLQFFIPMDSINTGKIVLQSDQITDTASYRILSARKSSFVRIKSVKEELAPSDSLWFTLNDLITAVDTSLIEVTNTTDSLVIRDYAYSFKGNRLLLDVTRADGKKLSINFKKGAVTTLSGISSPNTHGIKFNPARKYGSLIVDVSYYSTPIVVRLLQKNKLIEQRAISAPSTIQFTEVPPGEYHFEIILDENSNGKWDTGSYEERKQPELIDAYSKKTKVRPNWDIDVQLIPATETDEESVE